RLSAYALIIRGYTPNVNSSYLEWMGVSAGGLAGRDQPPEGPRDCRGQPTPAAGIRSSRSSLASRNLVEHDLVLRPPGGVRRPQGREYDHASEDRACERRSRSGTRPSCPTGEGSGGGA